MTLAYVVDTDWIIDHFNGIEQITRMLDEKKPAGLAISVVPLAELYEGVLYSRDPTQSKAVLQRFLAGVSVLPIDEEVCEVFGRERGRLRQRAMAVGDFDLLIASTCLRHDLTLCTNNRRHFEMVNGLRIVSFP
jgi:predicted nucleic acid-binding protein